MVGLELLVYGKYGFQNHLKLILSVEFGFGVKAVIAGIAVIFGVFLTKVVK